MTYQLKIHDLPDGAWSSLLPLCMYRSKIEKCACLFSSTSIDCLYYLHIRKLRKVFLLFLQDVFSCLFKSCLTVIFFFLNSVDSYKSKWFKWINIKESDILKKVRKWYDDVLLHRSYQINFLHQNCLLLQGNTSTCICISFWNYSNDWEKYRRILCLVIKII